MRLFLGVFPPPEVREAAYAAMAPLREGRGGVAWVKPANLHFTLRFLGALEDEAAARAAAAGREAVAGARAFDAALGPPGAFPNPRRARVLWLGMAAGADALVARAEALDAALRARGFPPADHPFTPHLTLGRVRAREEDWRAALEAAPALGMGFRVDRISLVESRLSAQGSTYLVREEFPLQEPIAPG